MTLKADSPSSSNPTGYLSSRLSAPHFHHYDESEKVKMKAIFAAPATAALVYRAYSHKSLTPLGIIVAALTAIAHAVHPWNLPFVLLVVFFLAGTRVTKVKKEVKAQLTLSSSTAGGSSGEGGEGPRTHVQVLANSFVATVLILLHAYQLRTRGAGCFGYGGDLLVVGIIHLFFNLGARRIKFGIDVMLAQFL